MKTLTKLSHLSIILSSFVGSGVYAAPLYFPSGPQSNVPLTSIINGGWTQCYQATMAVPIGNSAEQVLNPCTGDYIMMAGRVTGSDSFLALAAALRSDAILNTGQTSNTHLANRSNWWFSDFWSWGFTEANDTVINNSCDVSASPLSMCLHTVDFVGGYRINNITGLNNSSAYEKVFFVSNERRTTPEPSSTLVLLALGTLGAGSALKRKVK